MVLRDAAQRFELDLDSTAAALKTQARLHLETY